MALRFLAEVITGPRKPAARRTSPKAPTMTVQPNTPIILNADARGHYFAPISIGGHADRAMIDSGASGLALSHALARRLGIDLRALTYDTTVSTGGGKTRAARFSLAEMRIGALVARAVDMIVPQRDNTPIPLVGASVLRQFQCVSSGDRMTIAPSGFDLNLLNYQGIPINGSPSFERKTASALGRIHGTPEWEYVSKIRSIDEGGTSEHGWAAQCGGGAVTVFDQGIACGERDYAAILAHEGAHAYYNDAYNDADMEEARARAVENAARSRMGLGRLPAQPTHHREMVAKLGLGGGGGVVQQQMPQPQPQQVQQQDSGGKHVMPNFRAALGWSYGDRTANGVENFARTCAEHEVDKKEQQWRRWYGS